MPGGVGIILPNNMDTHHVVIYFMMRNLLYGNRGRMERQKEREREMYGLVFVGLHLAMHNCAL